MIRVKKGKGKVFLRLSLGCSVLCLLGFSVWFNLNVGTSQTRQTPTLNVGKSQTRQTPAAATAAAATAPAIAVGYSVDPELQHMEFCAEFCYIKLPGMCTETRWSTAEAPAPVCDKWSLSLQEDIYARNQKLKIEHSEKTRALLKRGAVAAGNAKCLDSTSSLPMMFPDEFEFITKLLMRVKPTNYAEIGCGFSTSHYPLLAKKAYAIDSYPPWCAQLKSAGPVKCMIDEEALDFQCVPHPVRPDGTKVPYVKMARTSSYEDSKIVFDAYMQTIDEIGERAQHFDVAFVDGRFRVGSALKLLPYLSENSVLLIHDFFFKFRGYFAVLDYYDPIGHARSVVALRKKKKADMPEGWREAYLRFSHEADDVVLDVKGREAEYQGVQ